MELANLCGNRFLPQIGWFGWTRTTPALWAHLYDFVMRAADLAGIDRARSRIAGGARGDVLEIGIGTGLNLRTYSQIASIQGIDPSEASLVIARRRAARIGRRVIVRAGDAAALPYADGAFDVVVGTFVLCTVGDVDQVLRESLRVVRPGGTIRLLEHGRAGVRPVAGLQMRLAPVWARVAGGCHLDHDVRAAVEGAGLRIVEQRSYLGGLLVELVATA